MYTGTIRDRDGGLGAFLAQQMLLRRHSPEEIEMFKALVELRRQRGGRNEVPPTPVPLDP